MAVLTNGHVIVNIFRGYDIERSNCVVRNFTFGIRFPEIYFLQFTGAVIFML